MNQKKLPDGRIFKIHCSQISKIMGRIGLSDAQMQAYIKLRDKPTARTELQEKEFAKYLEELARPAMHSLPQTAKTFLHEWYANDGEELFSKEILKGNAVERDSIDFMCEVLGLGVAEKNTETKEDDYFVGTCDVLSEIIDSVIDVKNPWNCTTFHSNIHGINENYKKQGVGYCHLWKRGKFILFYSLMDTPAEVNYDKEVIYSDRPQGERWMAYEVSSDAEMILEIQERVELCRDYLLHYDELVKSKVGKITKIN